MTVLVTGGAGYIGSQMVYGLIDAGERVVVLDNLSTGHRSAVAAGVPLIVGESGDQPLVSRLIREHDVEAIIHFAASLIVPDSVRDPLGYYRNNTVNSRALIECAIERAARRQDADDGSKTAVSPNLPPDRVRIGVEMFSPIGVAHNRDVVRLIRGLGVGENAS